MTDSFILVLVINGPVVGIVVGIVVGVGVGVSGELSRVDDVPQEKAGAEVHPADFDRVDHHLAPQVRRSIEYLL